VRLPGDINQMILDKRIEIEGEEIDELRAWITDLDQWMEHYEKMIEEVKDYEKKFEIERQKDLKLNVNATKRAEFEQEHIEALEVVSAKMEEWTSRKARAEKAKKKAEEQIKMIKGNFMPNQNMFHKWGYTKTNSQNLQHKHNPFKIN